jgi:hypothetical protein
VSAGDQTYDRKTGIVESVLIMCVVERTATTTRSASAAHTACQVLTVEDAEVLGCPGLLPKPLLVWLLVRSERLVVVTVVAFVVNDVGLGGGTTPEGKSGELLRDTLVARGMGGRRGRPIDEFLVNRRVRGSRRHCDESVCAKVESERVSERVGV